jgi:hypothetical protein
MTNHPILRAGIVILALLAISCPVQAFTAKTLDITVLDNTDAIITFDYELTWYENVVVFANIVNPGAELAKAVKSQFNWDVSVDSVTPSQVRLTVYGFASRSDGNGVVAMKTPALSFQNAEKVLNKYWFARFVSPDFTPEMTYVNFPDGYSETFAGQAGIPSITHVLARSGP